MPRVLAAPISGEPTRKLSSAGGHLETLSLWLKPFVLHALSGDDESSYVDEWLVLAYYRLFRCYNECHERFTLQGLEGTAHTAIVVLQCWRK